MAFVLTDEDMGELDRDQKVAVMESLIMAVLAGGRLPEPEVVRFDAEVDRLGWGMEEAERSEELKRARHRVRQLSDDTATRSFIDAIAERLPARTIREKLFRAMGAIMGAESKLNQNERNVLMAVAVSFQLEVERLAEIKADINLLAQGATAAEGLLRTEEIERIYRAVSSSQSDFMRRIERVEGVRCQVDGAWLTSFAAADYLGFSSRPELADAVAGAVSRWGMGARVSMPVGYTTLVHDLERRVAALVGQPAAVVFRSTAHLAKDVFETLSNEGDVIFVEEVAYRVSRDAAKYVQSANVVTHEFVAGVAGDELRTPALIVCDAVNPWNGTTTKLEHCVQLAESTGAWLYIDDAQGVGVLGREPTAGRPYGHGGSGSLAHLGVDYPRVVHAGSLSKAFGVPVAFVAGPEGLVGVLRRTASSLRHSSGLSSPDLAAAVAALDFNEREGDHARARLHTSVTRFRDRIATTDVRLSTQTAFPAQRIEMPTTEAFGAALARLRAQDIWVMAFPRADAGKLVILFSALHTLGEAVLVGEEAMHSPEPFDQTARPRVLVSLTLGTDKMEHWPILKRWVGSQSDFVVLPCGHVRGECRCR